MRAHATPLILSNFGTAEQTCLALDRAPLIAGDTGQSYDENWLQALIDAHPAVLPVSDIEPALVPLTAVCRELPLPSGYVDNLLVTPDGGIVVVETKLWRNPQARREVVGQVLDYAKDLAAFSYDQLEAAVAIARRDRGSKLFDIVCGPEAEADDERRFVDAVSRNLRLGRLLLLIVGDGIQESAERLGDFLQRYVGAQFTLSLVELSLWRLPMGQGVLVQPRILMRTVQIERAVVRIDGGMTLTPAPLPADTTVSRSTTLSETQFFEHLAQVQADLPERLRTFLTELEPLGVYTDVKRGLSIRWRGPDDRSFHLGVVDRTGGVGTDYVNWSADSVGRVDLSHAYLDHLAPLVGGVVRRTPKQTGWWVSVDGAYPQLDRLLDRAEDWKEAIVSYIESIRRALDTSTGQAFPDRS